MENLIKLNRNLNSASFHEHEINLSFNSNSSQNNNKNIYPKLPKLKRKTYPKITVPHFPNKYVKMSKEEIEKFRQEKMSSIKKKKQKERNNFYNSIKNFFSIKTQNSIKNKKNINDNNNDVNDDVDNDNNNDINFDFTKNGTETNRNSVFEQKLKSNNKKKVKDQNLIQVSEKEKINSENYPIDIDEEIYDPFDDLDNSCLYRKIGNCYCFIFTKQNNPIFIIGPNYYMFFFISLLSNLLLLFLNFFYGGYLNKKYKKIGKYFILDFQFFYFINYILNPGYPKNNKNRNSGEPKELYKLCSECHFYVNKNKKVYHCYDCDICIENFKFHCPVTGKCIGRNIIITYYLFILSSLFLIGYILVYIYNIYIY